MTTILQRLLKHPHAAVFDKAPHAELVMRVRHDDGFVWAVADNVLSVTAGAFEKDYDLTAMTVGELAAELEADGFEVNALSSAFTGLSAVVLVEGRGDQDQSNGDKITGFTNLLYSFLGAYGRELRAAGGQIEQGLRQMVIHQAEDSWLDLWGALYNTPRAAGEDDGDYADRIPEEAFRLRVNALAIEKAILDITGKNVRIEEPWGELFRLDESQLSGTHKFYNGSVFGYHILRPVSTESIDWTDVLAVIERNRAAGVVVLPAETRLGFYVDASLPNDIGFGMLEASGAYVQVWVGGRLDYMRLSDYEETAFNYRVSAAMTLVSSYAEYDGPVFGSMASSEITGLTWRTAESPWDEFPWGEDMLSRTLAAPARADVYSGGFVQIDVDLTVYDDSEVEPPPVPETGPFGTDGTMTFDMVVGDNSYLRSVVQQPDGKLVVTGYAGGLFNIARVNDGSLDLDFGTDGITTHSVADGYNDCYDIALQSDGKPIVVGEAYLGANVIPVIARYTTAGALDPTFGTGGVVDDAIGLYGDGFRSIVVQADGKIVVGGWSNDGTSKDLIMLARYNSDGTLDSGFGTAGVLTTDVPDAMTNSLQDIAIQADGKLIACAGIATATDAMLALSRYTSSGALDSSFGAGGIVTYTVAGYQCQPRSVAIQADGKIVVAGHWNDGVADHPMMWRFNSDGSLDSGFGTGGTVDLADDAYFWSVTQQADGKLVAAGYAVISGTDLRFFTVRFNSDGSLDTGFASGGKAITDVSGAALNNDGVGVIQQSDGKLVVVGRVSAGTDQSAIVRYLADGSLDGVPPP